MINKIREEMRVFINREFKNPDFLIISSDTFDELKEYSAITHFLIIKAKDEKVDCRLFGMKIIETKDIEGFIIK